MLCPHCHTQIPDDADFCGECGAKMSLAPVPTTPRQMETGPSTNVPRVSPAEENAQNTALGIVVVASIAVVAILCGVIAIVLFSAI